MTSKPSKIDFSCEFSSPRSAPLLISNSAHGIGLNTKLGIRKFPKAPEHRKVAKEVSGIAFDRIQLQPQAGTLSEPGQFDICTRELDSVYGSEDVYRTARSLYRCWLSCTGAFPSSRTQDNWVVDAWDQARLITGARLDLIRQDEEARLLFLSHVARLHSDFQIKCDSTKLLTDIKTKIKHSVETSYEFETRAPDGISRNASRAQALLASTAFIYRIYRVRLIVLPFSEN